MVVCMYKRMGTLAELEDLSTDPFSAEFLELFNVIYFAPDPRESLDVVRVDFL